MTPVRVLMAVELSWLPNKDRILTAQVECKVETLRGCCRGSPEMGAQRRPRCPYLHHV